MELLLSVVKGLGSVLTDNKGNKVYSKDDDCLRKAAPRCRIIADSLCKLCATHDQWFCLAACLKDLQRLLRQDESETREAFQVLSQYNIAKSDLVPIIVTYPKETDIVYNACKLQVFVARADNTAFALKHTPSLCSEGFNLFDDAH